MRGRLMAPLLLLCLPLLAGCSSSGADIELLEQPATSQDALPADAHVTSVEPGTTRFAGRVEGLSFYLARPAVDEDAETPTAGPGACLIVVETEDTACGGGALPYVTTTVGSGSAQLVPDDFDTSELISGAGNRCSEICSSRASTTRSKTAETPQE